MRENGIKVEQFQFINFLRIEVIKQVNEHSKTTIVGYISDEESDACVERSTAGQKCVIICTDETEAKNVLFSGVIESLKIDTENGLRLLTIEGLSNTIYTDIKRKVRTFQDKNMSYQKVLDALENDDERAGYIMPESGSEKIGRMLVQYEETDWQFSKRIASRLNTVIIPSSTLDSPYISIGLPRRSQKKEILPVSYSIRKEVGEFLDYSQNQVDNISERDVIYYELKSREIFDLGDSLSFKGRQLFVYAAKSFLEGDELYHYYTLKEKSGFCCKESFNERIIGASLAGSVRDIKNDRVQVNIDDGVKQVKYPWFTYATVYSSSDGTGWYFMPEKGDTVRLYFPTQHEEDAYVISSTQVTHGDRSDPDTKFIRTIHGKEIIFKPDSICITNGAGSSITLDDEKGIAIDTVNQISLNANKNITISGNSKIIVKGAAGVEVQQNDSTILIGDNIDLTSGHTRIG